MRLASTVKEDWIGKCSSLASATGSSRKARSICQNPTTSRTTTDSANAIRSTGLGPTSETKKISKRACTPRDGTGGMLLTSTLTKTTIQRCIIAPVCLLALALRSSDSSPRLAKPAAPRRLRRCTFNSSSGSSKGLCLLGLAYPLSFTCCGAKGRGVLPSALLVCSLYGCLLYMPFHAAGQPSSSKFVSAYDIEFICAVDASSATTANHVLPDCCCCNKYTAAVHETRSLLRRLPRCRQCRQCRVKGGTPLFVK
jgi:hypothetical protein